MEYRRRVPRRPAGLAGFCYIEGEEPARWRDCEVIDISVLGLGVTFHHPQPWELIGRRITVDAVTGEDSVTIRLDGEIRNAAPTLEGDVRIGLEFVGRTEGDDAVTALLNEMRIDELPGRGASDRRLKALAAGRSGPRTRLRRGGWGIIRNHGSKWFRCGPVA